MHTHPKHLHAPRLTWLQLDLKTAQPSAQPRALPQPEAFVEKELERRLLQEGGGGGPASVQPGAHALLQRGGRRRVNGRLAQHPLPTTARLPNNLPAGEAAEGSKRTVDVPSSLKRYGGRTLRSSSRSAGRRLPGAAHRSATHRLSSCQVGSCRPRRGPKHVQGEERK